jgi:hypothetical protein
VIARISEKSGPDMASLFWGAFFVIAADVARNDTFISYLFDIPFRLG